MGLQYLRSSGEISMVVVGRQLLALTAVGVFATAALVMLPQAALAADVAQGNELFQRYCAGCHGPEGRGSRKSGFMPRPKNLTMKGYTDLLPDEYLYTVISKGGAGVNKSEYMPAFEGTLSKDNIDNIIAFIRTLVLH
jgi:mono/diheme cytochrome c family protein